MIHSTKECESKIKFVIYTLSYRDFKAKKMKVKFY